MHASAHKTMRKYAFYKAISAVGVALVIYGLSELKSEIDTSDYVFFGLFYLGAASCLFMLGYVSSLNPDHLPGYGNLVLLKDDKPVAYVSFGLLLPGFLISLAGGAAVLLALFWPGLTGTIPTTPPPVLAIPLALGSYLIAALCDGESINRAERRVRSENYLASGQRIHRFTGQKRRVEQKSQWGRKECFLLTKQLEIKLFTECYGAFLKQREAARRQAEIDRQRTAAIKEVEKRYQSAGTVG